MPFTLAHPAIVLPLKYVRKWPLSMTALVIGSMSPDFEYFIRMRDYGIYGHTLAGLFWFDIPLSMLLYVLYQRAVKDKLIDHLPTFFNRKFSAFRGIEYNPFLFKDLSIIVISIVIGILSHFFLDDFTHENGDFVKLFPSLKSPYGGWYHVYDYLQYLLSAIGLAAIFIVILLLPGHSKTTADPIIGYWLIVIAVMATVFFVRSKFGFGVWPYGDILISLIAGGVIGVIIASAFRYSLPPSENNSRII